MKSTLNLLFSVSTFFFIPVGLLLLLGISLIEPIKLLAKEVVAFLLMTSVFWSITLLVKNQLLKKFTIVISLTVILLLAFTKLSFYYHYGVQLSASALFVIFETNATETSEFLANYFDAKMIGLLVLFIIPQLYLGYVLFFGKKEIRTRLIKDHDSRHIIGKILFLILIGFSIVMIYNKFSDENMLLKSYTSYKEYKEAKDLLKESLAQKTSNYIDLTSTNNDAQTYVVVIGESTSSWHMSLYGYNRNTNPRLSEIQDELIVFDSVIAPNVHTILALEKALTFSNFEEPNKKENASLVQLANQAGFTTYWISNQKPVGIHESVSTIIANAAEHTYFMATDDYSSEIYDENLLPILDQVLANSEPKKIVFIHLIGTHIKYSNRYPKAFRYFSEEKPNNSFTEKRGMERVNAYDNAVRYNDSIVREIIERVRKTNTIGYVTYFSDHGDEVYDTMDLVGHNEYHGTRPMYEVPFLVWLSEKYKQKTNFDSLNISGRRYNLEDYIYSFSELSHIKFTAWDSTRSIFNKGYQSRPRLIKDGKDYDEK